MARIAHSGMTADEVTENVEAAVRTVAAKLRMVSSRSHWNESNNVNQVFHPVTD